MVDLETALLMADEVKYLPAYRAHKTRPAQLRKFLLLAKKVSDSAFMWRGEVYTSVGSLVIDVAPTLDAQVGVASALQREYLDVAGLMHVIPYTALLECTMHCALLECLTKSHEKLLILRSMWCCCISQHRVSQCFVQLFSLPVSHLSQVIIVVF